LRDVAKLAVDGGAKVLEVNLSCPNVANEGVLCYSRDAVLTVCRQVKERVGAVCRC
jgi:dihydroorotate dehydrogenase